MSTVESLEFREGWAGGCYVNGTATCVAGPEDYCDEDTFVPAHYTRANTGHPLRYCAGQLEDVVIGRCGDSGECSNLPSGCENEDTWEKYDESCTITVDSMPQTQLSYVTYGRCGNRCVWSPNDCMEDEDYIRKSPECTANKVQIGACFAGHAFCAPSQESCTQPGRIDEPFLTHQEVRDNVGANCYLSSLPPLIAPTKPPRTKAPNVAPTPSPFTATEPAKGVIDKIQTGAVVSIVVVVAIVMGTVIGVSAVCYRRRKNDDDGASWRTDKDHPPVPTEVGDFRPDNEYAASEYAASEMTEWDPSAEESEAPTRL